MKKTILVAVSLTVLVLLLPWIFKIPDRVMDNRFSRAFAEVLNDTDKWKEILDDSLSQETINEETIQSLLDEYGSLFRDIRYADEYRGIFLVTSGFFPIVRGIMISYESHDPIPKSKGLGVIIDPIIENESLNFCDLTYYWD